MKQKINLLIGFSILTLVVLSAMQYYLVKTTYEYKVAQFHSEIKEKLAKITDDYSDIDSTVFNAKDVYYKRLIDEYIKGEKSKSGLKIALFNNPFREILTQKLKNRIQNEFPNDKIDFAVVVNKFIVYNDLKKRDTLFSAKSNINNVIYGNLTSLKNSFSVRNYVATTSGFQNSDYKLLTEDTLFVSVKNWEEIILKRMAFILIAAIFSMLILISLFVIAIKALIQQKKVSDVKTDFINNITHELKTPLTTLSITTKLLKRKEVIENETVFNSLLETVERQNIRLQNIIDQVMNNSLGFEEIELQKETLKITSILQTIISDFKLAYPNVAIENNFETLETTLSLDKFHLTTALNNVLENAAKYGCQNITIVTSAKDGIFNISIKDDGIGIEKNKQMLLFEKFYRIEQGNIHNTKGLGLGLYYVDQIIKAHKGSIKVVSDLGKGALFTISIPSV